MKLAIGIVTLAVLAALGLPYLYPSPTMAQGTVQATQAGVRVQYLQVYEDPENGCQYLAYQYDSGLVPRVDPQGRHICRTAPP